MVDSCRQLTVSQSNGDEDTAGMVTILTGHQVEGLSSRSAAMKVGHTNTHTLTYSQVLGLTGQLSRVKQSLLKLYN